MASRALTLSFDAAAAVKHLTHMPTPAELLAFGERWRPYRTVASWYLWRAFERAGPAATSKIGPPQRLAEKKTGWKDRVVAR